MAVAIGGKFVVAGVDAAEVLEAAEGVSCDGLAMILAKTS